MVLSLFFFYKHKIRILKIDVVFFRRTSLAFILPLLPMHHVIQGDDERLIRRAVQISVADGLGRLNKSGGITGNEVRRFGNKARKFSCFPGLV